MIQAIIEQYINAPDEFLNLGHGSQVFTDATQNILIIDETTHERLKTKIKPDTFD